MLLSAGGGKHLASGERGGCCGTLQYFVSKIERHVMPLQACSVHMRTCVSMLTCTYKRSHTHSCVHVHRCVHGCHRACVQLSHKSASEAAYLNTHACLEHLNCVVLQGYCTRKPEGGLTVGSDRIHLIVEGPLWPKVARLDLPAAGTAITIHRRECIC